MKFLNRFSIAWQLTALAVIIAVAAIAILSLAVLDKGRAVLLTHEITDLGDEANLRVFDVRDQIRYFQWQLRGVARKVGTPFHDLLEKGIPDTTAIRDATVLHAWQAEWDKILQRYAEAAPGSEQDSRQQRDRLARRFLDASTVREAYWYRLGDKKEDSRLMAVWKPGANQFDFDARGGSVPASVQGLATDAFFRDQTPAFSHPQLELVGEGQTDKRCYVTLVVPIWVVKNQALYALVVRVDLTQYFINLGKRSSRHYFMMTDSDWRLLIHPHPNRVGTLLWEDPNETWHFRLPTSAENPDNPRAWLPDFNTETETRMMYTAGTRLRPPQLRRGEGTDDPTDAHMNLGDRYRFLLTRQNLPPYDPDLYRRVNELLQQESEKLNTATYPVFRFVEPNQEAMFVTLSHLDSETLGRLQGSIDELLRQWNAKRREKGEPEYPLPGWSTPIDCREFTAHLVRSRLSSYAGETAKTDHETLFQVIILASVEEIQDDINEAIKDVGFKWGVGVALGASGLALLSALWLTRPLKRITAAAEKLSAGEYNLDLRVQGPTEVNKLASSFQSMAVQIRQRGDELNKNLERIQTILKTAAEGIIVFNNHGRILEANLAAVKMFGYASEAEMKNRRADELLELPMKLSDPGQSSIHKKKDGESVHVFDEVLRMPSEIRRGAREDGSMFWIEVGFSKLSSQKLYTGIFRDVSARKQAEEMRAKAEAELKELNAELDDRVTRRTHELSVALELSKAAKKATDTFVANMSHELRQPLNIIIGFTEAQLDEPDGFDPDTVAGDLKKTLMAAKHLLDMINDLLDLAKIEAGMLTLSVTEFELPKLIEMLRILAEPLLVKNQNKLVISIDPGVQKMKADERRVKQILLNLLSNAAKFTDKGKVELQVAPEVREGRPGVVFRVIDTGKGMSPEQASRLFQRFYQVDDTTTRSQGGTGLGLAISRSLCKLMDGEIGATSQPGQGSVFSLWLPGAAIGDQPKRASSADFKLPPAIAHAAPKANGSDIKAKVLVVDDDDRVRELMERFLTKEGFEVLTAPNGVEGLRMAKEHHPAVITLDVMMPGIDGWGILAALKTDATTQNIPVVIVSMVDEPNRGFALGASDYINKPIDWTRLGSILRKFIRGESKTPVLVIEDDATTRGLIVRFLEKEGFPVVEAANGHEGLARYRAGKPSAILMDIGMPVMDGFQFVDELRKIDPLHGVPVIVLTGKDLSEAEQQRLTGGVSQILQKGEPENLEALLHLLHQEIRNVLHSQHGTTENARA